MVFLLYSSLEKTKTDNVHIKSDTEGKQSVNLNTAL